MQFTELAAPILVVASGVALGVVGMFFGVDSRDGFSESSAQRPKTRWFIEPRD